MAKGRKRRMARIAPLYGLFGAATTAANLGTQTAVHLVRPPAPGTPDAAYWLALTFGAAAGLVLKYLLDKRWIFFDRSGGIADHGAKFARYTMMGLAATAMFRGLQTGFFMIWRTQTMLTLGGAISLLLGYLIKYLLDKRFVFERSGRMA